MTPKMREQHVRRCAKAMARAEWRKFRPQAEVVIQSMMMNPEAAPQLEGRVKFKMRKESQA